MCSTTNQKEMGKADLIKREPGRKKGLQQEE